MKLQLSRTLMLLCAIAFSLVTIVGCKGKVDDTALKTSIEAALKSDAMSGGTKVEVKDGVATLTGECKDEMCKMACEKTTAAIKGVKSVVNNLTVAPTADQSFTPPVIVADDALTTAVKDALKSFPGVNATVKDGVISLAGKIGKMDRQKLMMMLSALKPKNIDVKGLLNN